MLVWGQLGQKPLCVSLRIVTVVPAYILANVIAHTAAKYTAGPSTCAKRFTKSAGFEYQMFQ